VRARGFYWDTRTSHEYQGLQPSQFIFYPRHWDELPIMAKSPPVILCGHKTFEIKPIKPPREDAGRGAGGEGASHHRQAQG
jgi:hypothetical protein